MKRLGPVSRATRFRTVGSLIIAGLVVEVWTLFQRNALGFMTFLGVAVTLIGLGVALNVYWVSLELSMTTDGNADAAPPPAAGTNAPPAAGINPPPPA